MPSLGEVSPPSQHCRPVLIGSKVPSKSILERNFYSSMCIPTSGERSNSSQYPKASCTAVGKSVQIKKSDTSSLSVSLSDLTVRNSSEVKIVQSEDICCHNSIGSVSHANGDQDGIKSGSQSRRVDNRNNCVSVAAEVTSAGVRKYVNEGVTGCSMTVNMSVLSSHGKVCTAWQVTDLLHHSPSVASESNSSSSNNFANSTTDWTVSNIKQKLIHVSSKCKGPFAHKFCCSDGSVTANDIGIATHAESEGDSVRVSDGHVEERKNSDEQKQRSIFQPENKNIRVSDIDEHKSKHNGRKREKKLKKLKKHKK
jgi:hypothetical protein